MNTSAFTYYMQDGPAAATDIADFELPMNKLGSRELYIGPRAAAADGDDRRMLAEQDNDPSIAARQGVIGEPPLQRQAVFEIDNAEKVDVNRKFRRGAGGRLLQAVRHSFSPGKVGRSRRGGGNLTSGPVQAKAKQRI